MYMAVLNFSVIAVKPVTIVQLVSLGAWRKQTVSGEEDHACQQWASAFKNWQCFFLMIFVAGQVSDIGSPKSMFIILGVKERHQITLPS